jgi:hypothetical protein
MAAPNKSKRRWFRFSLKTLLLFVLLSAVFAAFWRAWLAPYHEQRRVMRLIESLGGRYESEARAPAWLRRVFGDQPFQVITLADVSDCNEAELYLDAVCRSPWLSTLAVGGDTFGDQELERLIRCHVLSALLLDSTDPSDQAVADFKQRRPDVAIHRSQRRVIETLQKRRFEYHLSIQKITAPPEFMQNFSELHFYAPSHVDLLASQVTDEHLAVLRPCVNLDLLIDMSAGPNLVTDKGLANLASATQLRGLHINGPLITDAGLAVFDKMKGIDYLHFKGCQITDDGLRRLPLSRLVGLSLSNTKITDAGVARLKDCQQLRELLLDGTALTDKGLKQIAELPNLERLLIDGTNVTDAGVAHLKRLPKLSFLRVSEPRISTKALEDLRAAHPKLKTTVRQTVQSAP